MITIDENIQELFKLFPENADIKRIILTDTFETLDVNSFSKIIEIKNLKSEQKAGWIDNNIQEKIYFETTRYKKTDRISFSLTEDSLSLDKEDRRKLVCEIIYEREI